LTGQILVARKLSCRCGQAHAYAAGLRRFPASFASCRIKQFRGDRSAIE
jgi:hypothetical protein